MALRGVVGHMSVGAGALVHRPEEEERAQALSYFLARSRPANCLMVMLLRDRGK